MRFYYLISIFIIIIISSSFSVAQTRLSNKQIDSLIKINAPFIYKNPVESYNRAKVTYAASIKNNYRLGAAMSLRKIALYHSEILKDYNKALTYNDEGLELARKINNDSLQLFFNFGKGAVYGKLGFTKKAIKIIDECLIEAKAITNHKKRSLFKGDLYSHKAHFLSEIKPPEKIEVILENCIKAMKEYEKALDICVDPGYSNVGYYYSQLKMYDEAEYYIKKAISFYKSKKVLTCEFEYTNLSELYLKTGHYEKALQYADSSNAICLKTLPRNYNLITENYKNYKNVFKQLNETDKVTEFHNLELVYKDSLNFQKENQLGETAKYIIDKNEFENSKLQRKNYYLILTFVIVLVLIGFFIYFYYRNKKIQFKQQALLNEEKLEHKSSEITELKQKVSTSYNDLIEMAKKNDPLFISFFTELYPEFSKNLKKIQPDLTLVELKVCFYLKLKFTTKEIAEYTFVSIKAIQNRKNRLRKRLFIENDTDLYDWIDGL
jgi:tetratricopeptide (TPR) repeat protein